MGFENREYYRDGDRPNIRFSMPHVSTLFWAIAGSCLAMFIAQSMTHANGSAPVERWGAFTFVEGRAWWQPWRWITYQYLHGGAGHLFFNLLSLYFFLPWIESMWGWRKTLAFYTLGGIASAATFGLITLVFTGAGARNLIGASGSILAILGACALFFPDRRVIVFFFPMTIRALAALMAVFFLLSALADRDLSDAAHLGGLAFGFFAPYLAGPKLRDFAVAKARRNYERGQQAVINEQAEIDRILAKVSASGMHTLTRGEQKTLKQASERRKR